jgi:hypothetical protein
MPNYPFQLLCPATISQVQGLIAAKEDEASNVIGLLLFLLLVIGGPLVHVAIRNRKRDRDELRKRLEVGWGAYQHSLVQLKNDPTNAELRQSTLALGRKYSQLTREDGRVTIYDEMALMNDINAACAAAASPPSGTSSPTIEQRLMTLKDLLNKGLIDEQEYKARRQRILSELDRL